MLVSVWWGISEHVCLNKLSLPRVSSQKSLVPSTTEEGNAQLPKHLVKLTSWLVTSVNEIVGSHVVLV